MAYLEGQSLHFADTAVIPLRNIVGDSVSKAILVQKLILTDFITGNLRSEEMEREGRLEASFFAMQKVAALYNKTLHGQSLTFSNLQEGVFTDTLVHFTRNHYVQLLRIDSDTATYFEPSRGPNGCNVVMSRSDFEAQVSGHVLHAQRIANATDMTLTQMKAVKGSGFFRSIGRFFKSVFRAVSRAVEFVVDAVVNIVTAPVRIIQAISDGNWGRALMETAMFAVNFVAAVGQAISGAISATVGTVDT